MLAWLMVKILTRPKVNGLDHLTGLGPALMVSNHLGDADAIIGLAFLPVKLEVLAKIDLYFNYPWLGRLMNAYGVIWVHRGQPDRRALRAALQALAGGRKVALAPEGRESLSGSLEEGTGGAAYLALKAKVPILPMAFTGTENQQIFGSLKRLRRPRISLTIGAPFLLSQTGIDRQEIEAVTQTIMQHIAALLPVEYQGVYRKMS